MKGFIKGFKFFILVVLLALTAVLDDGTVRAYVNENFKSSAGSLAAVIFILRMLTNSPMFKKKGK